MSRILAAGLLTMALTGGCYVAVTPGGVAVAPSYAYVPGTQVQVVSGYDDVLFYDNYYWRYYGGSWQRSNYYNRGWVRYGDVPRVFLNIPSSHPAYRVVKHHPQYNATRVTPGPSPRVTPGASPRVTPGASPRVTPGASPRVTPAPAARSRTTAPASRSKPTTRKREEEEKKRTR
jgi:hypothetical protein